MKKLLIILMATTLFSFNAFSKQQINQEAYDFYEFEELFEVEDCLRDICQVGMAYNEARINSIEELREILLHITNKDGDPISDEAIDKISRIILNSESAF